MSCGCKTRLKVRNKGEIHDKFTHLGDYYAQPHRRKNGNSSENIAGLTNKLRICRR
jgi:hypothetical protein